MNIFGDCILLSGFFLAFQSAILSLETFLYAAHIRRRHYRMHCSRIPQKEGACSSLDTNTLVWLPVAELFRQKLVVIYAISLLLFRHLHIITLPSLSSSEKQCCGTLQHALLSHSKVPKYPYRSRQKMGRKAWLQASLYLGDVLKEGLVSSMTLILDKQSSSAIRPNINKVD